MKSFISLVSGLLVLAGGCSSPSKVMTDDLAGRSPIPYAISLQVDVQGDLPGDSFAWGVPLRERLEKELLSTVQMTQAAASNSRLLEYQSKVEDLPLDADLLLTVRVFAPKAPERDVGAIGVLSGLLWAAAGIPSWFIPDTRFTPDLKYAVEIRDRLNQPVQSADITIPPADLSFVDRATGWDYVFSLLIPPPLLPFDRDSVWRSFLDSTLQTPALDVASYLKKRYVEEVIARGGSFAIVIPSEPGDSRKSNCQLATTGEVISLSIDGQNIALDQLQQSRINNAAPAQGNRLGPPAKIAALRVYDLSKFIDAIRPQRTPEAAATTPARVIVQILDPNGNVVKGTGVPLTPAGAGQAPRVVEGFTFTLDLPAPPPPPSVTKA